MRGHGSIRAGDAFRAAPVPFRVVTDSPESHDPAPATDGDAVPAADGTTSTVRSVPYKGADLDSERGPGLGCFRFQVIALAALILLTPIGVNAGWPDWLTATLLFVTIALLLVTGQTIIFLLRLVAADRRGRRRPLASGTKTVGELEDASEQASATNEQAPATSEEASAANPGDGDSAMRQ